MIFAQIFRSGVQSWGLGEFLIAILVIGGAVAITFVVLKVMEIDIPAWVVKIFWIVLAVCIGVFAIRFLLNA